MRHVWFITPLVTLISLYHYQQTIPVELSNRHGIIWDPSIMYNSTNLHGTQQKGPSVYGQKTWVEFFNFAIIGWFAIN